MTFVGGQWWSEIDDGMRFRAPIDGESTAFLITRFALESHFGAAASGRWDERLQSLKESFWNNRLGIAKAVMHMDDRGAVHEGQMSVLQSGDFEEGSELANDADWAS